MSADLEVKSEIGKLRKLLIHSPDGGIGKIVPGKFRDWLYDDTVFLRNMQFEYDHYLKTLLYFLDPEKIPAILECEKNAKGRPDCYKPASPKYFNSDKVLELQVLLAKTLEADDHNRELLVASIAACEGCSYKDEKLLMKMDPGRLAKTLITGTLPDSDDDEFIFPPVPNLIFTRDIGIMIHNHFLLSKLSKRARRRESLIARFLAYNLLFQQQNNLVMEINQDRDFFLGDTEERKEHIITIEGGDVMMISPGHLIVGCSERTSPNAANAIINKLFKHPETGIYRVSVVKIPRKRAVMHIDTIFTQVSRNTWVMFGDYSEIFMQSLQAKEKSYLHHFRAGKTPVSKEKVEVYQFDLRKFGDQPYDASRNYLLQGQRDYDKVGLKIVPQGLEGLLRQISVDDFGVYPEEVRIIYSADGQYPYDEREQWTDSCNVVAVKEGVVIGFDRNEKTAAAFRNNGFDVLQASVLLNRFADPDDSLSPESIANTLIILPSSELSRGRGGSHCMSMPLRRDALIY